MAILNLCFYTVHCIAKESYIGCYTKSKGNTFLFLVAAVAELLKTIIR